MSKWNEVLEALEVLRADSATYHRIPVETRRAIEAIVKDADTGFAMALLHDLVDVLGKAENVLTDYFRWQAETPDEDWAVLVAVREVIARAEYSREAAQEAARQVDEQPKDPAPDILAALDEAVFIARAYGGVCRKYAGGVPDGYGESFANIQAARNYVRDKGMRDGQPCT